MAEGAAVRFCHMRGGTWGPLSRIMCLELFTLVSSIFTTILERRWISLNPLNSQPSVSIYFGMSLILYLQKEHPYLSCILDSFVQIRTHNQHLKVDRKWKRYIYFSTKIANTGENTHCLKFILNPIYTLFKGLNSSLI